MRKILSLLAVGVAAMAMVSCENQDTDFPDFDYQTGYFAYQTPIRTLVLGNDERADNSIDNAHKCRPGHTLRRDDLYAPGRWYRAGRRSQEFF